MKKRRTARVLLFDPSGAILLIRCIVPRPEGDFIFWLTPGGEIEPGESPAEAAARELHEELGLTVPVEGPIREHANQFLHQGEMRDNIDFYFRAGCPREAPQLRGVTSDEIALMQKLQWWTQEEIQVSEERIFPEDLAEWLGKLQGG